MTYRKYRNLGIKWGQAILINYRLKTIQRELEILDQIQEELQQGAVTGLAYEICTTAARTAHPGEKEEYVPLPRILCR